MKVLKYEDCSCTLQSADPVLQCSSANVLYYRVARYEDTRSHTPVFVDTLNCKTLLQTNHVNRQKAGGRKDASDWLVYEILRCDWWSGGACR